VRLRVLGTGTSFGVPQVGCACAVCRSSDPRDRRTRTAALIERGATRLLVDTPPELRLQLLGAGIDRVDAVLYTHEHADHTGGIDDLRVFSIRRPTPLPVFGQSQTLAYLSQAFRYIFDDATPVPKGTSKPRLAPHPLSHGQQIQVGELEVLPIAFEHGPTSVLGYRFGPAAYVTDVKRVGPEALALLRGVRTLVLSALWWRPHPTHQTIDEAIEASRAIGAERTYLTHLSHETGHQDLLNRLPAGIEPAYDGLSLEIEP